MSDIFPYKIYTVVENDTFESISDKLGISVGDIRYLNDLDITKKELVEGEVGSKETDYKRGSAK